MYKLGAASGNGAPPISLQAIWTADNGKLPPWKGDFHNDLNTQLSYWPAYSSNHLDQEKGFVDWLQKNKPEFEKYTRSFYQLPGLNVPGVTTLTGQPMGGWIQYSFGPTVAAWLGHHFYLHWRYSLDREFLEKEAYPRIKKISVKLKS
jgi:alpha-L-fucosidase 2